MGKAPASQVAPIGGGMNSASKVLRTTIFYGRELKYLFYPQDSVHRIPYTIFSVKAVVQFCDTVLSETNVVQGRGGV